MMDELERLKFVRYNVWIRRELLRLELELIKIELCDRDIIPNFVGDINLRTVNCPIGLEVYYG